jgi:apolipoprotein N-acyltransferase
MQIYQFLQEKFLVNTERVRNIFAGILIACGFAPTHLPGLAILGLALFFSQLNQHKTLKHAWNSGFELGLGCMGLGVSWIYVSIHMYGNLSFIWSLLATVIFVMYLALFPAFMAITYHMLRKNVSLWMSCPLFCCLWILSEFLRATFLGGFPWLLIGVSQIDTPLSNLLPVLGTYGVGFLTCLAACCLSFGVKNWRVCWKWMLGFIFIILGPASLSSINWSTLEQQPISVGVVQANVSMRNKWDEKYFWRLVNKYYSAITSLIGKNALIVLPESAIPVPPDYIQELLKELDQRAKQENSAILLGIPQVATKTEYFNTMMSLGAAKGNYFKQHLVPFGEFTPHMFKSLMDKLGLPAANIRTYGKPSTLVKVAEHSVASLICYELAYPELVRQQLPEANWIVSISDAGWFGHSFAMYQQLQMAQVLAMQTARYHVVANNDGLSSVIDARGQIVASLPAFSSGILNTWLRPATGATPWVLWGDWPILFICCLWVLFFTGRLLYNRKSY